MSLVLLADGLNYKDCYLAVHFCKNKLSSTLQWKAAMCLDVLSSTMSVTLVHTLKTSVVLALHSSQIQSGKYRGDCGQPHTPRGCAHSLQILFESETQGRPATMISFLSCLTLQRNARKGFVIYLRISQRAMGPFLCQADVARHFRILSFKTFSEKEEWFC